MLLLDLSNTDDISDTGCHYLCHALKLLKNQRNTVKPKEVSDQKYAVMSLYEELYDSLESIDPQAIYKAMKVLMKHHNLADFMEGLDPDLLSVVHENKVREIEHKLDLVKEKLEELI